MRPAGYDHLSWRGSVLRLLVDNTERWRRGEGGGQIVGWWCWGLGFVAPGRVGCLLHPALNGGQDLRELTGYGFKCASYWCVQALAFGELAPAQGDWLVRNLGPPEPFAFSSSSSLLMRLLAFGPEVAGAVARLRLSADLLKHLLELDPRSGWVVGRIIEVFGKEIILEKRIPGVVERIRQEMGLVVRGAHGRWRLGEVVGLWEERAWRWMGAGPRVGQGQVEGWRAELERLVRKGP